MRKRTVTAAIAGTLMAATVGLLGLKGTGTANAIANGELVQAGQHTFSVKLIMTGIPTADGGRRNSSCSGALISTYWVVTAGHCFRDFSNVRQNKPVADLTEAVVGRNDVNGSGGFRAKVVAVQQAPAGDVAIAKLDTPITGVAPLAFAPAAPAVGQVLRITGWGATNATNPVSEPLLRTGQMSVVSVGTEEIGVRGKAPQADTTPCLYDSGAPLFSEGPDGPRLHSVVGGSSFAPDCPHAQVEPTARLDTVSLWIQQRIVQDKRRTF